jgi:hypothetical protein
MVVKPVILVGAAVYTRDQNPGQDYDWYIKAGSLHLFEQLNEIYSVALRGVNDEVPKFAVMIEGQRIGFLIGDMPCQRIAHTKHKIYDTLYLEFDTQYQQNVLHAAAMLLLCPKNLYSDYEQHFTDYAEILFYNSSHVANLILKTVKLPVVSQQPDFTLEPIKESKLALFSDKDNRNRCARYLIHLAHRENRISFVFLSTGQINRQECQKIADKHDECIILTLSQEVAIEANLKRSKLFNMKNLLKL